MIKSILINMVSWAVMFSLAEGFEIDSRILLLFIGSVCGSISLGASLALDVFND